MSSGFPDDGPGNGPGKDAEDGHEDLPKRGSDADRAAGETPARTPPSNPEPPQLPPRREERSGWSRRILAAVGAAIAGLGMVAALFVVILGLLLGSCLMGNV